MVSTLGEEKFNLFLDLLLIQMPTVLIIDTGTRRGIGGTCNKRKHTLTEETEEAGAPFTRITDIGINRV